MLNDMPLYPTEEIIWDENVVPLEYYASEGRQLMSVWLSVWCLVLDLVSGESMAL